jgi:hypothetical protein
MAKPAIEMAIDNGRLVIAFDDGGPPVVVDPATMPDNLNHTAALAGYSHRLRDCAALSVVDGVRPTTAMKRAEIERLYEHMVTTGEFYRTGAGDGTGSDGLLVRALAESCGIGLEDARATVAGWDKKFQSAMRRDPELAPIIERLKTARAKVAPGAPDTRSVLERLRAKAGA